MERIVLSASAVIADWLTAVVCTNVEGGYHRANPSNTAAGLDLEDFSNERYGDGDRDGGYNYNYGQGDWHAVQINPEAT